MNSTAYIGWCNENEGRAYPISETATQIDVYGNMLPTNILADMCVAIPPEYADVYVAAVSVTPALFFRVEPRMARAGFTIYF